MDIMSMMRQAQNMQKKLKTVQDELAQTYFEGEAGSGAVVVTCDGQGKFKSIKIKAEAINPENPESVDVDTLETLEDVISQAIVNAGDKATVTMEEKMKAVTGGVKIPGLF